MAEKRSKAKAVAATPAPAPAKAAVATPTLGLASPAVKSNLLYYGDNLEILREGYIPVESVDLIYLDPPFNSKKSYNVIFKDESGLKFDAQPTAFLDTWHFGPVAREHLKYLSTTALHGGRVPDSLTRLINAIHAGLGENQMTAYLVEMSVRLVELYRVLKPTGSLMLHCDPTASHYLKLILDALFSPKSFRNEIIWHYDYGARGKKVFGKKHDVIFWYSKSPTTWTFNYEAVLEPFESKMTEWRYTHGGQKGKPMPAGKVPSDVWNIKLNAMAKEHLGYPTQKPLELLERLIRAASNEGEIVLDPFCGCGTALVASQKLGRKWIGIDVTYLAIMVMEARLKNAFLDLKTIEIIGEPTEAEGARRLAEQSESDGRYQFQWWAVKRLGGMPVGGTKKKGADKGIDGVISFVDKAGGYQRILISAKSGKTGVKDIREFANVIEREKAAMGVMVIIDPATKPMKDEADGAGRYVAEVVHPMDASVVMRDEFPKVQIVTVDELLDPKRQPKLPAFVLRPFQKAAPEAEQPGLWDAGAGGDWEEALAEEYDEDEEDEG